MSQYIFLIFCSSLLILFSCTNPKGHKKTNEDPYNKFEISQIDSVQTLHSTISIFNKSAADCKDSLRKYKIGPVNDTCIKYIYIIYAVQSLKKNDSIMVAQCSIKLTGFKKNKNDEYNLNYTLFMNDRIPISGDLSEGDIIYAFDYSYAQHKIVKAYLGQHDTFLKERELTKLYYLSLQKHAYQKYLDSDFVKLNPTFIKLVSSM